MVDITPLDAADLRARVQKSLDEFVGGQIALLGGIAPELAELTDALTQLLGGGKRLRPAFAYWGYRGAGGRDGEEAVTAAASLELLQACALIHDDVMDGSDTRRGRPAVHRRFATLHRTSAWLGAPDAFGTGSAILLGDLCLSWADEMLLTCGLDDAAIRRAKPWYDLTRTELMGGQYLDLLEQARGGGSTERAMRVVRYKSAKYTIERPLHIGGALAGANDTLIASYSAYGLPLGEAFQLRDDILGVFGDPAQTGKPAGDDIREGKRTVLVATAFERATRAQAAALRAVLGDAGLESAGVERAREVIEVTGARRHTEDLIDLLTARALAGLEASGVDAEARTALRDLAHAATARTG